MNIMPESRGADVFEAVIEKINLFPSFDFKLYIQTNYGFRAVENDEILWSLLVERNNISAQDKLTSLLKKVVNHTQKLFKFN